MEIIDVSAHWWTQLHIMQQVIDGSVERFDSFSYIQSDFFFQSYFELVENIVLRVTLKRLLASPLCWLLSYFQTSLISGSKTIGFIRSLFRSLTSVLYVVRVRLKEIIKQFWRTWSVFLAYGCDFQHNNIMNFPFRKTKNFE
jgi:hypothetical protein